MITTLKRSLKYQIDIYRIKNIHNRAKHILNYTLAHYGQKFLSSFNTIKICNQIIINLVRFDTKMTTKENKRLGTKEYTLYQILTEPVENIESYIHDNFDHAYFSLIIVTLLVASFMNRYDLGIRDWSKRALKHYKKLETNQKTFDPKESLYDAITKSYRLFTIHDASKLVRQAYLNERNKKNE